MGLARHARWLTLVIPIALASGAALARPAPPGAAAARPSLPSCPSVDAAASSGQGRSPLAGTAAAGPAWYRLDPVLDAAGTLAGQRLTAGRGGTTWVVDLPPESFASGPVGGRIAVGDDDGVRSRLRLLDTVRGCWAAVSDVASVVRSAVLTPDGKTLYEHRVDRATRRDLGVWRRGLDARPGGEGVRVLPGLGADDRSGPTFATSLAVAADGRVVVSACGERSCRVRVQDPGTGAVAAVDGVGPAVGVAGAALIVLDRCDGLPCPLLAVDIASGRPTGALDEAAGPAALTADGRSVVLADEGGIGVAGLQPGAPDRELPGTAGLAPLQADSTAASGIEAPAGTVAVAPGGLVADPRAVRFLDPASLQLAPIEVQP
jgi:hypothetical protein